jgi:hypothetical protein
MNIVLDIALPYGISYIVFFALASFCKRRNSNRLGDGGGAGQSGTLLISLHLAGIVLFGILPYFSGHLTSPLTLSPGALGHWPIWVPVLTGLLIIIVFSVYAAMTAHSVGDHETNILNLSFLAAYFCVRIFFVISYETWFRGFFLNDCIVGVGPVPAVAINIGLYALLHVVNGKTEMLACIPFGILLCTLCIWQQAVWPAIAIHLGLSISYEASTARKLILKNLQHVDINNRGIWIHRKQTRS